MYQQFPFDIAPDASAFAVEELFEFTIQFALIATGYAAVIHISLYWSYWSDPIAPVNLFDIFRILMLCLIVRIDVPRLIISRSHLRLNKSTVYQIYFVEKIYTEKLLQVSHGLRTHTMANKVNFPQRGPTARDSTRET